MIKTQSAIRSLLRNINEQQVIFFSFLITIIIAGGVLSLPISSRTGDYTNLVDSFFTAISAACVTGLTVLDTSEHWSFFGQVIILFLIQLGGLGLMAVISSLFLSQKASLKSKLIVQKTYGFINLGFRKSLVKDILVMSLIIEIIGSVLLSFAFIPQYGVAKGIWFSVFHTISAYCNAGFDLFGNSLISYSNSPYVLSVIALLIILGGLGFIVIIDLLEWKEKKRLSLHSRLALITTGALIIIGMILFWFTEISTNNGGERHSDYLIQGLFFSITPRTAGFAIQDYSSLSQAGLFLTFILMAVGGTSGSTAGGVKTTTLGVFLLNIRTIMRREKNTILGKRTIPYRVVKQAYEVIFLYVSLVVFSTFILLAMESRFTITEISFEVFSALSTVGLSMNVTSELGTWSKVLVGILMFIGRVGIFTVIYSLNTTDRQKTLFKYPEESLMVG